MATAGTGATLETALQRDKRRLPGLLQWVRYSGLAGIQLEAIKLTQLLAARMPSLVDLLLQSPTDGTHFYLYFAGVRVCVSTYKLWNWSHGRAWPQISS